MRTGGIIEGRYQIIKQIGKGGGGIVYLANHLSMQKQVVLKEIINAMSWTDPETLRTEVDILKRLKHPALPQVYDFLQTEGKIFTVMEYIPGYSLQEYMNAGQVFSQEQILIWARELAEVISYMHTRPQPVIHRDIKPSNIMIKPDGHICLIDFNISDDTSKAISQEGYSNGYASPEQTEKGWHMERRLPSSHIIIDERTDIYSIGAVLYCLLCGRLPGEGRPTLESMDCCFFPLARVVDKCLRQKKEKRYQTAEELLYDLNHLEKTDADYIRYTWYARLAGAFGIFLLAAGVALILMGVAGNRREAFYQAYEDFVVSADNNAPDLEIKGLKILNSEKWDGFLENHPEEKEKILYRLAQYYVGKQETDTAIKYYSEALATGKASEECYLDFAQLCLENGNDGKAQTILAQAKTAGAGEATIALIEGQIAMNDEDYEKAAGLFQQAEASGTAEQKAKAASYYGKVCILQGNYEEAKKVLSEKSSREISDWLNLSPASQNLGERETAEEQLLDAAMIYPDDYRIYVRLAILEYELQSGKVQTEKNYKKMQEYYDEAAAKKPEGETSGEWEQLNELIQELKENGWL